MNAEIAGTEFVYDPKTNPTIIKIIGVGGGGGNAVNYMYESGEVTGVSFLLFNTDQQDLDNSPISHKVAIGSGLGAGANPEVGCQAAEKSVDKIREAICEGNPQMVFITASMGGGTGTGATPVVSRVAREAGLLVVAIVTVPFGFEGHPKVVQALKGVSALEKEVDALVIIYNDLILEKFAEQDLDLGLIEANKTLTTAAKGISDVVNTAAEMNLDMEDVRATLRNGGVAIINTASASGENRVTKAFKRALEFPFSNNNNYRQAKTLLFMIYIPKSDPILGREAREIEDIINSIRDGNVKVIWGKHKTDAVDEVTITVLATGFDYEETNRYLMQKVNESSDSEAARKRVAERMGLTKEEERLIEKHYGKGYLKGRRTKKTSPLVLSIAELNCQELLDELENTPAINRDEHTVERIRQRNRANAPREQSQPIRRPRAASGFVAPAVTPTPTRVTPPQSEPTRHQEVEPLEQDHYPTPEYEGETTELPTYIEDYEHEDTDDILFF